MNKHIRRILTFCILFFSTVGSGVFSQIRWDSLRGGRFQSAGAVLTMYADSNYLYAAGEYNEIGGKHMQGIARWNGVKWDSLSTGIDGLTYMTGNTLPLDDVWAITTYNNKMYVCGQFSSLGNVKAAGLGTWNGSVWDSLSVPPLVSGLALAVINNKLYMGGAFATVAGIPCIGVAYWNDTNWSSLNFPNFGADYFQQVEAVCEYNGNIYVGGIFADSNYDTAVNILRYDGAKWHSVGNGIRGGVAEVWCMADYDGELYVGGRFFKSDGNAGNCIQRWNGASWSDVGGSMDLGMSFGVVENLFVFNGKLYAIGGFNEAGGITASNIAEWDGTKWCSLEGTFGGNGIGTSCIYKDTIYVGGGWWTIDNDSISYIAKWTGGDYTDSCGNDATGINKLQVNNGVVGVYPNPNNGTFTISLSNVNAICNIEIYNVLGEKVSTETLPQNQNTNTIELTGQPNGVYFYRVLEQDGGLVGDGKVDVQK